MHRAAERALDDVGAANRVTREKTVINLHRGM
jgi:hypothetical protein